MVEALFQLQQQAQAAGWLVQAQDLKNDPWTDVHGLYHGQADLLLCPDSTAAVVSILKHCHQFNIKVVIQSGNTGYSGGATPTHIDQPQILLSLVRLNKIRQLDLVNQSITVDAGCCLQQIQEAVARQDRWFPLGLSVADTCLIGGNLATNAGGVNVLRYGNTRDLVLGIEAVFANGEIYHGLQRLRKNNNGYDLKNLLIGSEGTLAVITAAVLKLYPAIKSRALALVGFNDFKQALPLLNQLQVNYQEHLSAFEYWQAQCLKQVTHCYPQLNLPFKQIHKHYLLIELSSQRDQDLDFLLDIELQEMLAEIHISTDIAIMQQWWQFRGHIPKAQQQSWSHLNSGIKHDIALPLDKISEFVEIMATILKAYYPSLQLAIFGHLGDGNLHYNIGTINNCLDADVIDHIHDLIYQQVQIFEGSFSAEHGIGQAKRHLLIQYSDPYSLELMRQLKHNFDPLNLLNPSKVL